MFAGFNLHRDGNRFLASSIPPVDIRGLAVLSAMAAVLIRKR